MKPNNKYVSSLWVFISICFFLLIIISFETAQQLYYVKRYNIRENPSYFDFFSSQLIGWVIWLLIISIWIIYWNNKSPIEKITYKGVIKYLLTISIVVVFNIAIFSFIQFVWNGQFVWENLIFEYFPFYAFQKLPIYTLAYVSTTTILYYYFTNQHLKVEVKQLGELKSENKELYERLSSSIKDESKVLNIKIGHSQKIIPINTIRWIEADDYCSKIHTVNEASYTMRISLNALSKEMSSNFIRVHRSAIVNMDMVDSFKNGNPKSIVLKNNIEIPVAKSKLKLVKAFFSK